MKLSTKLLFALLLYIGVNPLCAQDSLKIEKNSWVVVLNYGGPNVSALLLKDFEPNYVYSSTISGIGPLEARAEYLIGERFSIGLSLSYADAKLQLTGGVDKDSTLFNYTVATPRFRIMSRATFYSFKSKSIISYSAFSAGYTHARLINQSSDPNYEYHYEGLINYYGLALGLRFSWGLMFFPVQPVGFNLEFGIGSGAFINAGLVFRLGT